MTYLLDNNIVSYFLHARREAELSARDRRRGQQGAEAIAPDGDRFKAWFASGAIASIPIAVGSDMDATYQALTPPTAERGKGERASIALAAHDPTLVLVANDRNAMWLALAELHHTGERMIGVPVFLRRLHEQAGLSPEAIDAVIALYPGRRPTWWADWRARLGAAIALV